MKIAGILITILWIGNVCGAAGGVQNQRLAVGGSFSPSESSFFSISALGTAASQIAARYFSLNRFRNATSVGTPNGNGLYSFMPMNNTGTDSHQCASPTAGRCISASAGSAAPPMPSAQDETDDRCSQTEPHIPHLPHPRAPAPQACLNRFPGPVSCTETQNPLSAPACVVLIHRFAPISASFLHEFSQLHLLYLILPSNALFSVCSGLRSRT